MDRVVSQWKEAGITIEKVEYYEDGGRSGKNLKRPEVRRLQNDIQRGELDLVLAMKIDRLSRSTDDFRVIEKLLEDHNVEFCPINDFYDPSNAQGWFMSHMTIGQAEYERRVTSERTRLAMDYRARQGWWNGGHIYGYRKDKRTEKLDPAVCRGTALWVQAIRETADSPDSGERGFASFQHTDRSADGTRSR